MSDLPAIFFNNLLPVFLASGAGFWLGNALKLDPRALSRVVFYIFSPALMFTLLIHNQLDGGDILRMMGFTSLLMVLVATLTWVLGRLFRLDRRLLIGVLLTAIFMNAGNFGLSVTSFAFGEAALAQASLFFITMGILTYTVGVILASLGQYSLTKALLGLLKLPFVYALALGLVFIRMDWTLPLPLDRTASLLSQAAIPGMLVLLGMQLGRVRWNGGHKAALALSTGVRLVVSPLIAFGLATFLGFNGPARQAGILEAGMPSAVMTIVLATEFDLEPSFVTTVVFTSTLLSPLTLTPLLALLGS